MSSTLLEDNDSKTNLTDSIETQARREYFHVKRFHNQIKLHTIKIAQTKIHKFNIDAWKKFDF